MIEKVEWCAVCNERPADGTLTIVIDQQEMDIPACTPCVNNTERVEFV